MGQDSRGQKENIAQPYEFTGLITMVKAHFKHLTCLENPISVAAREKQCDGFKILEFVFY